MDTTRCEAAEGCTAPAVVKILAPSGTETPACDVHGAHLLAATCNGKVYPLPGEHDGYATAVWYGAQAIKQGD
ncbi:hypothetical protein ACFV2Q_38380 [Streptomyces sp. NPDC059650]|uniref:hypothetical protein n=1 Tax=Streptomyces sp. NPDC059650 TaxID=3346896 RepID=UPI0036ACAA74